MTETSMLIATASVLFLILVWRAYLFTIEQRRTATLQRYESLFRHNADGVVSLGPGGGILDVNAAFTDLTGWTSEDVAGTSFVGYVVSEDRPVVVRTLKAAWEGEPKARETVLRDRQGRLLEVKLTTVPIQVGRGVVGVYQIAQDIRLRKEIERKLETQALYDYLTGLPNRALFQDRLDHAVERSRRPGTLVALLYVDLDRFKAVNDSAGHAAGDEILKTVANRLGVFLRGGDTVARIGGDEFAILLEDAEDESAVLRVATRITEMLAKPIELPGGSEAEIGGSVGVALATAEMHSPEELVRQADIAMYEAKRVGGHRYHVYRPGLESKYQAIPLEMEGDLRRAIERGELDVAYQPIVDLAGTRIVGVEALARWRHPKYGVLPPSKFVPLAEETGLIVPLDRWVLRRACREVKRLRPPAHVGEDTLFLSVNYSKLHLEDEDSVNAVARVLTDELFQPARLQLEITESIALTERARLRELKELGVMLAIDDFGTGFSSLGYLQDVDVDVLKIDRSFVKALGEEQSSAAIVRTILTLASVLKLGVIIEGVEDSVQLRQLQELGGRYVQGFYFAEPMTLSELEDVVRRGLPPEWVLRRGAEVAEAVQVAV